ncbi:laccase domain-containing protein, partial [Streptococcus suis]
MSPDAPIDAARVRGFGEVPHGFLGRRGGVSTGVHAGLNVGTGSADEAAAIEEKRTQAVEAVAPGAALATVHQLHSADAVTIVTPYEHLLRPRADAMVTTRPDI